MSQRAALLELERKKIALLRSKLEEQERKVRMLEQMEEDPLDALLEKELLALDALALPPASPPVTVATQTIQHSVKQDEPVVQPTEAPSPFADARAISWAAPPRLPRRVPDQWVKVLQFLGREGKSYDQVLSFITSEGLPLTAGAIRAQMMNYRKDFDFVANPKKGFYVATDRALAFIAAQKGEDPAVGTGGVFSLQPSPLDRAAA